MKKLSLIAILSSALLLLPSILIAGDKGEDLFKIIHDKKQLWAKLYNANDAAAVTSLYTEDATVIAPNYGPAKGHAEIQAGLEEELGLGDCKIVLKTLEVERLSKKAAHELGYYSIVITMAEGDPIVDEGHYVIVWKKVDDDWKIHVDMWNTSLPLE